MSAGTLRAVSMCVVVLGSGLVLGCNQKSETIVSDAPQAASATSEAAAAPQSADVEIKDPAGYYKPFSDASITRPPEPNLVFGNGQILSLEYDGSKSKEGDSVFYQVSYVNRDGSVLPATAGPFDGTTRGTFKTDKKIYTSDADGRPGFLEVSIVQNAKVVGGEQGITGQNVRLGVYPIRIETSK